MNDIVPPPEPNGDWQGKLRVIVDTMREMSQQTDPQANVRLYGQRMRWMIPRDAFVSLSRRGIESPGYRITRSSTWQEEVNPWTQKDRLPLLTGGLFGELIYGEEPVILNDLNISPDDPAIEYLVGMRSAMALPQYHEGKCLNMVVNLSRTPGAFNHESLPELVLISNLFGRATSNLVLAEELKAAQEVIEAELQLIGFIQRSLLPRELPAIPTLELAVHYQTSRQAGGDYYDFFPLPDGCWGLFLADVSGHGTPSAVVMAITHAIAHTHPGPPSPPGKMLAFLNRKLSADYTAQLSAFVTAFYGVYNPQTKSLVYACAGHNPPRLVRNGIVGPLDSVDGVPLGVDENAFFPDEVLRLKPGDQILLYTDGIIEAFNPAGEMFGLDRLDTILASYHGVPAELVEQVLGDLRTFTEGHPLNDDCTLVAARVT